MPARYTSNDPGRVTGFTLLEVITTLAISILLLTSGIPAMQRAIQATRHTTHINNFIANLQFSRGEAVRRGRNVVMCRSGDGESCANTEGWHMGWIIFADNNLNREHDDNEQLLQQAQGWQDGITVTSGQRRRVVYQPSGQSPGSNGTYIFCHPGYPDLAKAVILSNSGRPRLSTTQPDGDDLECGQEG